MSGPKEYAVNPGWGVLAKDLGLSPSAVLRRAGLPQDLYVRGPEWLSTDQYFALWSALEEEFGDRDALPIRIGESLSAEAFDPPIFAALCSRDLNGAAERIARFKRLIGPMRVEIEVAEHETTITYRWPAHVAPPVGLAATELVFWVALVRLATRTAIEPRWMTMPDPPADPEPYRRYLGQRIGRGDTQTVAFAAADAARPFITANDRMWEFFEPELRRRLSELEARSSTTERVRAALLELLPAGAPGVGSVARELAISPRTLQRRLREEGTTFQSTLDATREELARHYLTRSSVSAGEISFLLGYEDPNSFYRAFHSWTGQTPAGARAAAV